MRKKIVAATILTALFCSGCSIFQSVTPTQLRHYQLNPIENDNFAVCEATDSKAVLQVSSVKADNPYDTNKMFYSKSQYQLTSYNYTQWVGDLGTMLTQEIQERLLQSCLYSNVVNADFMTNAQYRLNTQLLELKQIMPDNLNSLTWSQQNKNIARIHLVVVAQLVDNSSNKVVKSKSFVEDLNVTPDAHGYVMGSNAVVKMFLDDLATWLK